MTDTGALAKALAAFQADMPVVAKAHTAKVPTKAGGSYSYTYAGLADVMAAAIPLLTSNGLSFTTCPRQTERGYELVGRLLHTSGESLEGALPIAGNSPQELGSSLTYMRRYLFGCITGLVTDDDDDGAAASRRPAAKRPAKKAAEPSPADPWDNPPPAGSALLDTRSNLAIAMYAAIGSAGIPEEERIEQVGLIIGRPITSTKQMTESEARRVLDHLKQQGVKG